MAGDVYQYRFDSKVAWEDVESSLVLALMAVEALHGQSQTRLDAAHAMCAKSRSCAIDATTDVGRSLNRLFTGFLTREFGPKGFSVERLDKTMAPESASVDGSRRSVS